jgi:hypothetical protein
MIIFKYLLESSRAIDGSGGDERRARIVMHANGTSSIVLLIVPAP